jgi:hypothetical protein
MSCPPGAPERDGALGRGFIEAGDGKQKSHRAHPGTIEAGSGGKSEAGKKISLKSGGK